MRAGVILCAVIGHRWHVDETSTEVEPVIRCDRCGATEIAPDSTAFGRRLEAETRADRALGPFGGRR
jgi:hypothetical protein